ncbi:MULTISPECIES: SH3 domain-containing protein [unclassified Xanthobacter]|uniref:SH3 domain-containing protein n=1 Tax=unclassified Xanthobacter TaxID=2623496 RepID=UPI001EDEF866|nr:MULTISPECIES: SH3 domain-containing protein [unclassified Xanthobacter]
MMGAEALQSLPAVSGRGRRVRDDEEAMIHSSHSAPVEATSARQARPAIRPRVGMGTRGTSPMRKRARLDRGVLIRSVSISAGVVVAVFALLALFHWLDPQRVEMAAREQAREAAAREMSASVPAAASAVAPSAIALPVTPASGPAGAAAPHAITVAAAPADSDAAPAVAPAPSAEDFSRPAFVEPEPASAESVAAPSAPVPVARPALARAAPEPARDPDETASIARQGRIASDVTLRKGPRRGADAIGTLEAGTKVDIFSCTSWCEVAADGKRGYVYRRAVDR